MTPSTHPQREEGVYYDESYPNDCCEKCHDVTFEKTYPAHTAYHACLNLKCPCHSKPQEESKEYGYRDHTHCFNQKKSPCGIKGKHACCLCLTKPPQTWRDEFEKEFVQDDGQVYEYKPDDLIRFIDKIIESEREKAYMEGLAGSQEIGYNEGIGCERQRILGKIKEKLEVYEKLLQGTDSHILPSHYGFAIETLKDISKSIQS